MITYNPDGGDLGRAHNLVTPLEFQLLLRPISNILDELKDLFPYQHFVYPFEFHSQNKDQIRLVMMSMILPNKVNFYQSNGISIFEICGDCGGVVSGMICYLVTK